MHSPSRAQGTTLPLDTGACIQQAARALLSGRAQRTLEVSDMDTPSMSTVP